MAATGEELAEKIREISVAEFFEKNRHLLGYENPTRSLLTVIKEAVENSADACEDARILPEIKIELQQLEEDRFRVVVEDNGPGLPASKVPMTFAKFLVGSKFHRLKQYRGLMGVGIHGAVLYAQLTTGKPAKVVTSLGGKDPIHEFELMIDVAKNEPEVISHRTLDNPNGWHGVKLELEVEGRFIEKATQSVPEYIRQTAMVNPFASIYFKGPNGTSLVYKRRVEELPPLPKEIKPHPYGIELGRLRRMLISTSARTLTGFLTTEFSRVGRKSALEACRAAGINPESSPQQLSSEEVVRLHKALQSIKLMAPPTDCLSPLGEEMLLEGMKREFKGEKYVAVSRPPSTYRGYPFQIECGIAYGGELQDFQLFRFANRTPLLYHQGECALTSAVREVDWRRYGIPQDGFPKAPMIILLHFVSVWVPFTTEGKQAIASYPEILREAKLALQDAGRRLSEYLARKRKMRERQIKIGLFERYIPELAESVEKLTGKPKEEIISRLERFLNEGKG
ncbi:MAG: DNA topoisomerase VI subunit B [Candidatus Hadarchaeales archaeon]